MGGVKSEWIEAQERGWSAPDTFVCDECVEDEFLKKLIIDAATAPQCDYCQRKAAKPIAAEAGVVIETIYNTVFTYYTEPSSGGVPYDDGFLIDAQPIDDVLEDIGFEATHAFYDDVIEAEANGDYFVPAAEGHWASSHPHEILSSAWMGFSEAVKHETRFHFARRPKSANYSQDLDVSEVLPVIADQLRRLARKLPRGTEVFRSRVRRRGENWNPTADQLGPPPKDHASAGRMNPAGIPYFYGSFDRETARREVGIKKRTSLRSYTARFSLSDDLLVVDLTNLPEVPSIFDLDQKDAREHALFIREFVRAISAPVQKDGREHIDYVPSQVICEYLAQVFRPARKTKLDGLIFQSAVQPGGKNLVAFPNDRLGDKFQSLHFAGIAK